MLAKAQGHETLWSVGLGHSTHVARTVGGRTLKVAPALASPGDPGSCLATLKGPDARGLSPSSTTNRLFETVECANGLALLTWGSASLGVHGSPMEVISHCLSPVVLKTPHGSHGSGHSYREKLAPLLP